MAKYIRAVEAAEKVAGIFKVPMADLVDIFSEIPAADVAPVVHGCFEPCFDENGNWRKGFAKCSNCGKEYYAQVINHFGYCPNCGAKMDGGVDNGGLEKN